MSEDSQPSTTLPGIFETCIGCGICKDFCPVFEDLFALAGERADGAADHDAISRQASSIASNCYFCGRCTAACPLDLPLEQLAWERLRESHEARGVPRTLRWSSDIDRLTKWRARLGRLVALLGPLGRKIVQKLTGIDVRAPLPPRGKPRLRRWWKKHERPTQENAQRVALFAGCLAGTGDSSEARALVEILERSGCVVELVTYRHCCGAPEFAAGRAEAAARKLRGVTEQLRRAAEGGADVVLLEHACVKMLRLDGKRVLEEPLELLHVFGASEYLWKLHSEGRLAGPAGAIEGGVAWLEGCLESVLSKEHESLRLLRQIPGLEVTRMEPACCAMGGAWGLRNENYERAAAFCENGAARQALESGAQKLATGCAQCRLQLGHHASEVTTVSVIELYRQSLEPSE